MLVGNLGCSPCLDCQVCHGAVAGDEAGQKQCSISGGCIARLLLLCVFKPTIRGNDSCVGGEHSAGSSVAETSDVEVEVKVTTVLCFPLASYRVMFQQSEKRTLKHLPLS